MFIEDQTIKDIEKLEILMPKYSNDFTGLDPIPPTLVSTQVEKKQQSVGALDDIDILMQAKIHDTI